MRVLGCGVDGVELLVTERKLRALPKLVLLSFCYGCKMVVFIVVFSRKRRVNFLAILSLGYVHALMNFLEAIMRLGLRPVGF